ncbi:MAG: DNA topoisomerase III [Rhodovulum sulfidophilum]|uniref:DNA topoisomerase n=1 Tax=Rhodovulum sulfidophilum TaxID=35806 RepID=A0A2W5N5M0_RHOSU|nr:MAG: DNA topoisomerase III [Rhodovulum sulfidophilum]
MTSVVLCEKPSQAQTVRAAIGARHGKVLAAAGHLLRLRTPEETRPEWKTWSFDLLWPGAFYGKTVDPGRRGFFDPIKAALAHADRVIVATDPDREGLLLGMEIVEFCGFAGEVLRANLLAMDPESIRKAFAASRPFSEFRALYDSGRAREQADQLVNLSLTRAATVGLRAEGTRGAIGVGRVKTPTLALLVRRAEEIRNFKPRDTFQIDATVRVAAGTLVLSCARLPGAEQGKSGEAEAGDELNAGEEALEAVDALEGRILARDLAERLRAAAEGFRGPVSIVARQGAQTPPRLFDLTGAQAAASARFGWSADHTLELAQNLYAAGLITYPRSEETYLPEAAIAEVGTLIPALLDLRPYERFRDLLAEPTPRTGKKGHFSDRALAEAGASHHAIIPNIETADRFTELLRARPREEQLLFNLIATRYLAALAPDFTFLASRVAMTVPFDRADWIFAATGRVRIALGWRAILGFGDKKEAPPLPAIIDGEPGLIERAELRTVTTRPPSRYTDGGLIRAMKEVWRFVPDDEPELRARLRDCKGIGTAATRAGVIDGLVRQGQVKREGKFLEPTDAGERLCRHLDEITPNVTSIVRTAQWETLWTRVARGEETAEHAVERLLGPTQREINQIAAARVKIDMGVKSRPTKAMIGLAEKIAERRGIALPKGLKSDSSVCREFLDAHAGPRAAGDGPRPPSERQLAKAREIATRLGEAVPDDALATPKAISAWIEARVAAMPKTPASAAALGFARKLAEDRGVPLPEGIAEDARLCAAFIDEAKSGGTKKGDAKKAGTRTKAARSGARAAPGSRDRKYSRPGTGSSGV